MFSRKMLPAWIGIIMLSGMFLMGQGSENPWGYVEPSNFALYISHALSAGSNGVMVPDSESLDITDQLTIEAWVKPGEGFDDDFFRYFLTKNMNETGYGLLASGYPKRFEFRGVYSATLLSIDEWVHVAAVYNEGNIELYVNGQLDGTAFTTAPLTTNDLPLYLGWSPFGHDTNWRGLIDEIRIWKVARTQVEILALMHWELSGDESGLVAYWNFNDGPGSEILTDSSGYGNDGILFGDAGAPLPEWVISDAPVAGIP